MQKILVIKLGALGDFIQATGAFADIRAAYPKAHITLLTTNGIMALAKDAPWFDAIEIDKRKPFYHLLYLWNLSKILRGFDMVFDLQTNKRTSWYFKFAGRPQWNGIAKGCSHPHLNPNRNFMHSIDRIAEQISCANVTPKNKPNIQHATSDCKSVVQKYSISRYIVFVAGGSAHRPGKRWPHFAEAIGFAQEHGIQAVLIGSKAEETLLADLAHQTNAINLCGETNINQLITLLQGAECVIGNDTGPMQLAGAAGAESLVIFGPESNPNLCAPRGNNVHILQAKKNEPIGSISPEAVRLYIKEHL